MILSMPYQAIGQSPKSNWTSYTLVYQPRCRARTANGRKNGLRLNTRSRRRNQSSAALRVIAGARYAALSRLRPDRRLSPKDFLVLPRSNRANQHPREPFAVRDLPSCDSPPRALGRGASFVRPEFGGARHDLPAGVVSRKQSARALPALNSGRPSSGHTGSACPRISLLPARARAPPSLRQRCGPCRQASSVPSNGRREIGNAWTRVPANFGNGDRTFGDIPLIGLRGTHGIARHHFAVFGRCSAGDGAAAWGWGRRSIAISRIGLYLTPCIPPLQNRHARETNLQRRRHQHADVLRYLPSSNA